MFIYVVMILQLSRGFYSDQIDTNKDNNNNNNININNLNNAFISYPEEAILFHQSELCQDEEMRNNLQCFKEIPEESYEVMESEDVLMKCVVGNQKGKAQWRYGDSMLGFNRKIPHKSRFSMVGDETKGDQSLLIKNVSRTDGGEYECQVTRGDYGKKELRRASRLIVLVIPSPPLIFEKNNKLPSKTILIPISARPHENSKKKLNIRCVSNAGQPEPTFQWYHNSRLLITHFPLVSIIDSSSESHLIISVTQFSNGDTVSCVVFNKATMRSANINKRRLKTTVPIIVNTLPGAPKIIDITRIVTVQADAPLTVSCKSQPAGEPPGSLKWLWKSTDEANLDSEITRIPKEWISNSSVSGTLISNLMIPRISIQYHGLLLVCKLQHELLDEQHDEVKILIEYGPKNLTIDTSIGKPRLLMNREIDTRWINTPSLFVQSGEKVSLRCSTSNYYTELIVTWSTHEGIYKNRNVWKLLDNTKAVTSAIGIEKVQTCDLDLTYNSDNMVILRCEATAKFGFKLSRFVILESLKTPSNPILKIDKEYYNVNSDVHLQCFSIGGNPIPSLKLCRGDKEITTRTTRIGKKVILEYGFKATKESNLDRYRCYITSIHRVFDNLPSNEIIIKVRYPPTTLSLTQGNQSPIRAGEFTVFNCISDEAYPVPEIRWTKYDCVDKSKSHNINFRQLSQCHKKGIESTETVKTGKWNGSIILQSQIKIVLNEDDNNNVIQCSETSGSNGSPGIQKYIPLNVTHAPIFDKDLSHEYVVQEGYPLSITLHARANPPVTVYEWSSGGAPLPESLAIVVAGTKLTIIRSDLDMMRNYTLTVHNSVGSQYFTIKLNITFGPRIIGPDSEVVIMDDKSSNAKLICKAQSNPTGERTLVTWNVLDKKRNWNLLEKRELKVTENIRTIHCENDQWSSSKKYEVRCSSTSPIAIMSTLQISNLVPSDTGRYQCFVNNTIEAGAGKIVTLYLPVSPRILISRRRLLAGGEISKKAKISCWIFAYPKPKVSWYRETSNLTLISGKKFNYNVENMSPNLYNAVLIVEVVTASDYRNYFCQADNSHGTDTGRVELVGSTKPDTPNNVHVINKTESTITMEWYQGFNGGYQQNFNIAWRPLRQDYKFARTYKVVEDGESDSIIYTITNVLPDTDYEIRICSSNKIFPDCQYAPPIVEKTLKAISAKPLNSRSTIAPNPVAHQARLDNVIITITSISVFVFVILVINILFLTFYIRKRRLKHQQRSIDQLKLDKGHGYIQCSTMEMYSGLKGNHVDSSIPEVSTNNSQRSSDSAKNSGKNHIDNAHKSLIGPNHGPHIPASMLNSYIQNQSTSIYYPNNLSTIDRVIMHPSTAIYDTNHRLTPSPTTHSLSPGQSSSNSYSLNLGSVPHSLQQHSINLSGQPELLIDSIGLRMTIMGNQLLQDHNPEYPKGGFQIPSNDLYNSTINYGDRSYYRTDGDRPFYGSDVYEQYYLNNSEVPLSNNGYDISYSGSMPKHQRPKLPQLEPNKSQVPYKLLTGTNPLSFAQESRGIARANPNDSASNSSQASSNVKRYRDQSYHNYHKSLITEPNFCEDGKLDSFIDDAFNTAV